MSLDEFKKTLQTITKEKFSDIKDAIKVSSNVYRTSTPLSGKDYPGRKPLLTYRALAWGSTVVSAIITFRKNQVLKKDLIIVSKDLFEPPFKFSLIEYTPESIFYLPSLDESDKDYLARLLYKKKREWKKISEIEKSLTPQEKSVLEFLQEKHLDYYFKRIKDTKNILSFLRKPDPYFSEENSWQYLLSLILEDILTIDRGALLKLRDEYNRIIALVPLDGTTIKPLVDERGRVFGYVQIVDNYSENIEIPKNDIVLFRQNLTPDVYMYGYSVPPIEILYNAILSDIFIDKGNLDYYRKGGSIPEGIIAVEPPSTAEGDVYPQLSAEQLNAIQRQIQAIMMGDFTQVPIVSGGKFTWIDFKGKRRDMQFRELAEYVARKICAVYQVSPQDVGILEGSNKATAEVMASLTKAKGLEPLLALISRGFESVIDELREEKDVKLWFREDDLEKERDWWSTVQGKLNTGFLTINEARLEKGLEPVPWGDVPFAGLRNWEPPQDKQLPKGAMPQGMLPQGMPSQGILPQGVPMPQGLTEGSNEDVGSQQSLEILKQILSANKSLENNLLTTIELVSGKYDVDSNSLKEILKSLGADSFVKFMSVDEEQISSNEQIENIAEIKFKRYIDDVSVNVSSDGVRLYLLTKEPFGYREALAFISLFFDLSSPPGFVKDEEKLVLTSFNAIYREVSKDKETLLDKVVKNVWPIKEIIFTTNKNLYEQEKELLSIDDLVNFVNGENEYLYDLIYYKFGLVPELILVCPKEKIGETLENLSKERIEKPLFDLLMNTGRKNIYFFMKKIFTNKVVVKQIVDFIKNGRDVNRILPIIFPYKEDGAFSFIYENLVSCGECSSVYVCVEKFYYLLERLNEMYDAQIDYFLASFFYELCNNIILEGFEFLADYPSYLAYIESIEASPIEKSILEKFLSFEPISQDEFEILKSYETAKVRIY